MSLIAGIKVGEDPGCPDVGVQAALLALLALRHCSMGG